MRRPYLLLCLLAALLAPLAAQEGGDTGETGSTGETGQGDQGETGADPFAQADGEGQANGNDALGDAWGELSDDELVQEVDDATAPATAAAAVLVQETIKWGGLFSGSLEAGFSWENPFSPQMAALWNPDGESLSPLTSTDLYFSARPAADYRVFGKFKLTTEGDALGLGNLDLSALQFVTNPDGSFTIGTPPADESGEEEEEPVDERLNEANNLSLTFSVYELFADFSWNDRLFFRFGKAQIAWGVGYFFSPADVLNLAAIDAEDPTADRSGPLNLKINFPIGINNLDLFIVTDRVTYIDDIAIAPRFSLVLGGTELGFGAYYQRDLSPRLVTTVSSSWRDISLFGEAVLAWGSDRVYVRQSAIQPVFAEPEAGEDPSVSYTALDTFQLSDQPFFQGTAGFMWRRSDPNLSLSGQYFFNGTGYPDSALLEDAAYLFNNPDSNGQAIADEADQPDGYQAPLELERSDLNQWGQHYAALSVGWQEIIGSDLSLNAFLLMNLADLSGIANASLSYRFFARLSASLGARLSFGSVGSEYANPAGLYNGPNDPEIYKGPLLDLNLTIKLGGGSF